jgi:hypothetical protein
MDTATRYRHSDTVNVKNILFIKNIRLDIFFGYNIRLELKIYTYYNSRENDNFDRR